MTRFSDFTNEELDVMESAFCNEGLTYFVGEIRMERRHREKSQPEKCTEERTETHGVCLDVISRQTVLDEMYKRRVDGDAITAGFIKNLPSVTPQPKTGHWIESDIPNEKYICSESGGACWYYDYQGDVAKSRFCPNCGAKME